MCFLSSNISATGHLRKNPFSIYSVIINHYSPLVVIGSVKSSLSSPAALSPSVYREIHTSFSYYKYTVRTVNNTLSLSYARCIKNHRSTPLALILFLCPIYATSVHLNTLNPSSFMSQNATNLYTYEHTTFVSRTTIKQLYVCKYIILFTLVCLSHQPCFITGKMKLTR